MSGSDFLDYLKREAAAQATRSSARYHSILRPRLEELFVIYPTMLIREAAGEDVETQLIALQSSMANMALAERSLLQSEAQQLALRVLAMAVKAGFAAIP